MRGRFNRPGYERVAKNRQAPAGRLSRLEAIVDEHSTTLENVDGEGSVTVRKNYKGGLTIGAPPATGTSAAAEYASYFKVYDASTETACKIGVTDGGTPTPALCGVAKVNGTYIALNDPVPWTVTVASAGVYHVWLHMWIDVNGEHADIRLGDGGADDDDPPDNPHGGLAFSSQLLGRVTVANEAITSVNQDYLRGGEHSEYLFGDCDGFEVES